MGTDLCVKAIRVIMSHDREKLLKDFYHEAIVWKQLRHPNIHVFMGVVTSNDPKNPKLWLISPWMNNGTIHNYMKANPGLNRVNALAQMAAGLHYLHSFQPQVIHRDIKGNNILVDDDGVCRLSDFGISTVIATQKLGFSSESFQTRGTPRWLPPERLDSSRSLQHDLWPAAADVYSFGCTAIEIYTGRVPFHDIREDIAVALVVLKGHRPERPMSMPESVWGIVQRCWSPDPSNRIISISLLRYLAHEPLGGWKPDHLGLWSIPPPSPLLPPIRRDTDDPSNQESVVAEEPYDPSCDADIDFSLPSYPPYFVPPSSARRRSSSSLASVYSSGSASSNQPSPMLPVQSLQRNDLRRHHANALSRSTSQTDLHDPQPLFGSSRTYSGEHRRTSSFDGDLGMPWSNSD